jgi:hypothetical protein
MSILKAHLALQIQKTKKTKQNNVVKDDAAVAVAAC